MKPSTPPLLWVMYEPDENPDAFQGVMEVGAELPQPLMKNEYLFPLLPPGNIRISLSYSPDNRRGAPGHGYREIIKRVHLLVDGETSTVNFDDTTVRVTGNVQFQGRACGEGSLHARERQRKAPPEESNARLGEGGASFSGAGGRRHQPSVWGQ